MREKAGLATFVVVLVAVWVAGFLWVRGDLSPSARPASAGTDAHAQGRPAAPSTAPAPEGSTGSSSPGSAASSPSAVLTGKLPPLRPAKPVRPAGDGDRPPPEALPPVAEFTMATFNILGSTHTGARGHSPRLASGPQRMGGVLSLLAGHGVSVVGLQEFQPNQRAAFQSRARGWSMYPGLSMGRRAGENSVAWRDDTWELVSPALIDIPYFRGRIRPMPYVLLRHKETGVQAYFSTFHNPADVYGPAQRFRNAATEREISLFNRLEATGIPQFVTGDMNERTEYFCRVTAATPLKAAAGGSNTGGCRPPARPQIDWIFGSPAVDFTTYVVDRSALVRRTSDHPIVVSRVAVDALKFANAYRSDQAP